MRISTSLDHPLRTDMQEAIEQRRNGMVCYVKCYVMRNGILFQWYGTRNCIRHPKANTSKFQKSFFVREGVEKFVYLIF